MGSVRPRIKVKMISIVSFSVGAPVPVDISNWCRSDIPNVPWKCPKIFNLNDMKTNINWVETRLFGQVHGSPKWEDIQPVIEGLLFIIETLKNQTETLNSLISPPPPPPSPSPPPPSPPPPSRCYYWSMVLGEGKTQKLMCKLGF